MIAFRTRNLKAHSAGKMAVKVWGRMIEERALYLAVSAHEDVHRIPASCRASGPVAFKYRELAELQNSRFGRKGVQERAHSQGSKGCGLVGDEYFDNVIAPSLDGS